MGIALASRAPSLPKDLQTNTFVQRKPSIARHDRTFLHESLSNDHSVKGTYDYYPKMWSHEGATCNIGLIPDRTLLECALFF